MTARVRAVMFIDDSDNLAADYLDEYLDAKKISPGDIIHCNLAGVGNHAEILLVYRQGSDTEPIRAGGEMKMALFEKKEMEIGG